jgi:hypothetical protein
MLKVDGDQITYELSLLEVIGAFGNSPTSRVSNLKSVSKHDNPWTTQVLRGIRAPGTGFPYLIMLGTLRHRKGKDFCVVYKRRPVLVLEFESEPFKRWVIPCTKENLDTLNKAKLQVNLPE